MSTMLQRYRYKVLFSVCLETSPALSSATSWILPGALQKHQTDVTSVQRAEKRVNKHFQICVIREHFLDLSEYPSIKVWLEIF